MSTQQAEIPRETLKQLLEKNGEGLFQDRDRCEGLLKDHCGSYRREISALVGALDERVPLELKSSWQSAMTPEAMRARLVQRLEENRGLAPEVAAWAVDTWSYALGVGLARTSDRVDDVPAPILPSVVPGPGLSVAERVASDRVATSAQVIDTPPQPQKATQKRAGMAAVVILALAAGGYALWHKPVPPPPPPQPAHNDNGGPGSGGGPSGSNNGGNGGTNNGGTNGGTNNGGNNGSNSGTNGSGNGNNTGTHGSGTLHNGGSTTPALRIPAGTLVSVRLDRAVNSEEVADGDLIAATVSAPIVVNGDVLVATGAHAHLRVSSVDATGQADGAEHLSLALADVESERGKLRVVAPAKSFNGPTKTTDAAKRAGIGAAAGAVGGYVVGKLFHHGGAGAAAGAGGGAVTGAVTAKAGPAKVASETLLQFHLSQSAQLAAK